MSAKCAHPDIKFIMLVDNKDDIENYVKNLAKNYQLKKSRNL
jgi:hypothetical protein